MKCAIHPDQDAVGICKSCGSGVCVQCRSVVAGLTYCSSCLEAGRYRPPGVAATTTEAPQLLPPGYTGTTNPLFFKLAIIGVLLLGIAVHLIWIGDFFSYSILYLPLTETFGPVSPLKTVAFVFVGVGMTLGGFAFHGYRSQFGSRISLVAGTFSFISAWWLLIADLIQYTGLVWIPSPWYGYIYSYSPGTLHFPWYILHLVGFILYSITLILWSTAIISTRKLTRQNKLSVWSAILFLVAVHIILVQLPFYSQFIIYYYSYIMLYSYLYTLLIVPACFVESACILAAIIFNRSRTSMKMQ